MSETPLLRHLPANPSLEYLRKEAKQLLKAMRLVRGGATLADAQFRLARGYGFSSWRALREDVGQPRAASLGVALRRVRRPSLPPAARAGREQMFSWSLTFAFLALQALSLYAGFSFIGAPPRHHPAVVAPAGEVGSVLRVFVVDLGEPAKKGRP